MENNPTNTFIKTSTKLAQSKKLNSTQKLFISYILGWQDNKKICFASNNQIAFELGLEYEGVRSIINRLNKPEFGFLTIKKVNFQTEYGTFVSKHELIIDENKLAEFLGSTSTQEELPIKETIIEKPLPIVEKIIIKEILPIVEEEIIEDESQPVKIFEDDFDIATKVKRKDHTYLIMNKGSLRVNLRQAGIIEDMANEITEEIAENFDFPFQFRECFEYVNEAYQNNKLYESLIDN